MTLLDAYAVIAYLRGEPHADEVVALLRTPCAISAANAAEVLDQLVRVFGRDCDDVHADMALLSSAGMDVLPVTADIGLLAGRLRANYYDRQDCAVSLADCLAGATALMDRRRLATSDPALARMIRAEGGAIYPLSDSVGRKP